MPFFLPLFSVYSLMSEIMPFFMVPVAISVLSFTFRLAKDLTQGVRTKHMAEELTKKNDELIKEEKEKINIDKDLQKYFNYKE